MTCKHYGCSRKPKHPAYGSKRTKNWCEGCDANLVPPKPLKSRARQAALKEILVQQIEAEEDQRVKRLANRWRLERET